MMYGLWLAGLVKTRSGRLFGTAGGIAITVAVLATLGVFLRTGAAEMTQRAVAAVPVDWQVLVRSEGDRDTVEEAIRQSTPVTALEPVLYAEVSGVEAASEGTTQATGAGVVLGVEASYFEHFPAGIRGLLGATTGVLLAQQTAANLHASVGDPVVVHRVSLSEQTVKIDGIVELPTADSLFQVIGVAPGAAPQAPPDNVLILPVALWHQLFDAQAEARPDTVRLELHVRLDHAGLPSDPVAAATAAADKGRNFEARSAGSAVLANNLSARLEAVREDALYAWLLFLFLGAPGIALSALLTLAIAAAGGETRRRDQALLRLRGASLSHIMRLAAAETMLVGVGGGVLGAGIAELASRLYLGATTLSVSNLPLIVGSMLAGVVLSAVAVLAPAWLAGRGSTVVAARRAVGREPPPLWSRLYLDVGLLILASMSFWRSAAAGYQTVLAPEGVAATAVDYSAFLAPALLWGGLSLLTLRLGRMALRQGRPMLVRVLSPFTGPLSGTIAATFARQSRHLAAGLAMSALAFAFAASTAIFNATYQAQARVDAELTNGADVTLTGTAASPASPFLDRMKRLPGVAAAQPMQHRFAYVGTDLQDLYGIDPVHIGTATDMSDAYFADSDAGATLAALEGTPDGVLVSQETVNDYQLSRGDRINLRLQHASDHQYRPVSFRIIGVVREFPTAPKDSFLVANAAYVAAQTGAPASEIVLLRANGDPARVAEAAAAAMAGAPGIKVTSIDDAVHLIGSSLTAINLGGLTRLELSFALVMVTASVGLLLALGLADRQLSFAILAAIGAKPRQLGYFVWSEAGLTLLAGATLGLLGGWLVAWVLVKLLSGVFDPPPDALSIPWPYLAASIVAAVASVGLAAATALAAANLGIAEKLRGVR